MPSFACDVMLVHVTIVMAVTSEPCDGLTAQDQVADGSKEKLHFHFIFSYIFHSFHFISVFFLSFFHFIFHSFHSFIYYENMDDLK